MQHRKTLLLAWLASRYVFYVDGKLWFRHGAEDDETIQERAEAERIPTFNTWSLPRGRVNEVMVKGDEVLFIPARAERPFRRKGDMIISYHNDVAWMDTQPNIALRPRIRPYATPRRMEWRDWRKMTLGDSTYSWSLLQDKVIHGWTEVAPHYTDDFPDIIFFFNDKDAHVTFETEQRQDVFMAAQRRVFLSEDSARAANDFKLEASTQF